MKTSAFPIVTAEVVLQEGMQLRDHFAAACLQSLAHAMQGNLVDDIEERAIDTARACYILADAMMAARTST